MIVSHLLTGHKGTQGIKEILVPNYRNTETFFSHGLSFRIDGDWIPGPYDRLSSAPPPLGYGGKRVLGESRD